MPYFMFTIIYYCNNLVYIWTAILKKYSIFNMGPESYASVFNQKWLDKDILMESLHSRGLALILRPIDIKDSLTVFHVTTLNPRTSLVPVVSHGLSINNIFRSLHSGSCWSYPERYISLVSLKTFIHVFFQTLVAISFHGTH